MIPNFSNSLEGICAFALLICIMSSSFAQSNGDNQARTTAKCLVANSHIETDDSQAFPDCPDGFVDLNQLILNDPPPGCEIRWYTNEGRQSPIYSTPEAAGPGTYAPFFYDPVNNCFHSDNAIGHTVTVKEYETYTNRDTLYNLFGVNTGDLHRAVGNDPRIWWFTNPNHQGEPVPDPTAVGEGTYWAFLRFEDCETKFDTDNSTTKVVMKYRETGDCRAKQGPGMSFLTNNIIAKCVNDQINLDAAIAVPTPDGCSIRWYTSPNPFDDPYDSPQNAAPGSYYAFFYDPTNNCYHENDQTGKTVQVSRSGAVAPLNVVKNDYVKTTVNLNTKINVNMTTGGSVVWFTNAEHTGESVADPTSVGEGTYYAFIKYGDCYDTDQSTAKVTVNINLIQPVDLKVKVSLQGAMSDNGSEMRNDLQTFDGHGTLSQYDSYHKYPLSPIYGHIKTQQDYPDILNLNGPAGSVVDWIVLEIRKASSLQTILASVVALLKTDGSIVGKNGNPLQFYPENDPVQIVVRHRNHLPVISVPLVFASGQIMYDFTTSLDKAFQVPNVPDQMVIKNNVWCMWAGNAVQGLAVHKINIDDYEQVLNSNSSHANDEADINLDGVVDVTDVNILFYNSSLAPYSILP